MAAVLAGSGWVVALAAAALAAALLVRLRAREELVARACHELRSPLTAARLAVHAIGAGDAATAQALAVLDLELRRAGLALDDLVAARDGARAGDVAELLEAHEVVQAVAESFLPVARGLGAELRVEPVPPGLFVRGDRLRLVQAVGNLVGNALEHGAGPVTVRARCGPGGSVRLEVHDGGPGLPAPVAALAARPRAGRGRRGRGLAIATDVAVRHGGRLVSAPSPRGARLALELPLLTAADEGGQRGPEDPPLAGRMPWWRRVIS
ncbi:MAG TPA: ATP-binding protein [Solirubrobacteraceae bacterium]|jgi:signal transduction histidine kinase